MLRPGVTSRPASFYGHAILFLCFLNMFMMVGIRDSTIFFNIFNTGPVDDFGWSRGVATILVLINGVLYGAVSPLVGWCYDRLGPRIVMSLGAMAIGLGLVLSGQSTSLSQFLFYGLPTSLGMVCIGAVTTTALLSHWFRERIATAIGVATMGLHFGILFAVPVVENLISALEWRTTYALMGVAILVLLVPLNILLPRRRPGDVGQLPDGRPIEIAEPMAKVGDDFRPKPDDPDVWTLKGAVTSIPFWVIAAGLFASAAGLSLMHLHSAMLSVFGLATRHYFNLISLARCVGSGLWGVASDRLGRDRAYAWGTFVTLGDFGLLLALPSNPSTWWLGAFALFYGLGTSASTPTYGAMIADIFGGKNIGVILGFLQFPPGVGAAFGPVLGGVVYDITDSNAFVLVAGMLLFPVAYLCIHCTMAWRRDLAPRRGEGETIVHET